MNHKSSYYLGEKVLRFMVIHMFLFMFLLQSVYYCSCFVGYECYTLRHKISLLIQLIYVNTQKKFFNMNVGDKEARHSWTILSTKSITASHDGEKLSIALFR